jgi:hypothetical protein
MEVAGARAAHNHRQRRGRCKIEIGPRTVTGRCSWAPLRLAAHARGAPSARGAAQVYTELVVGLGEAIVSGLVPGSAMSAVAKKDALDEPRVSERTSPNSNPNPVLQC